MLYFTGDLHGSMRNLQHRYETIQFYNEDERETSQEEDYLIVCGDFGFVWFEDNSPYYYDEQQELNDMENLPITICFVDGNHENFHRLNDYPVENWHGGRVHRLRKNVVHLMRGEVFNICGKTILAFGGAPSHDIAGIASDFDLKQNYAAGVLDRDDVNYGERCHLCNVRGIFYRTKNLDWWAEEMPTSEDVINAYGNLPEDNKVDYIVTHEAPLSVVHQLLALKGIKLDFDKDTYRLSKVLQAFKEIINYKKWYCGHYHQNKRLNDNIECLYHSVVWEADNVSY